MCTVVVLHRPGAEWPVLIAANRDEMRDRDWLPPGEHWPDRPGVVAGLDILAGGTWMAINEHGVVAALLDRMHSLGPAAGKRSRGELSLEAMDHADASDAVQALADLNTGAYRPFHMIVADNRDGYWLRSSGKGRLEIRPLEEGVSMLTASDVNDRADPRIAAFLPRFQQAPAPDPEREDGFALWESLLGEGEADERSAMWVDMGKGFGTVSSSLIALPEAGSEKKPVWLFSGARPVTGGFVSVL